VLKISRISPPRFVVSLFKELFIYKQYFIYSVVTRLQSVIFIHNFTCLTPTVISYRHETDSYFRTQVFTLYKTITSTRATYFSRSITIYHFRPVKCSFFCRNSRVHHVVIIDFGEFRCMGPEFSPMAKRFHQVLWKSVISITKWSHKPILFSSSEMKAG
jgi:hypothetical protein